MDDFINRLPKTETHVHIEAVITQDRLRKLTRKYKPSNEYLQTVDDYLKSGYENIIDFFNLWKLVNSSIREGEDLEIITYEYLEQLHRQNTLYAELSVNLFAQLMKGLSPKLVAESIFSGQKAAAKDFGIVSRTIFSYSRDWSHKYGKALVDWADKLKDRNVVGIDISGNETVLPNQKFREVFAYAKKMGVERVAHAGERAGAQSIWAAVKDFEVTRIGHGLDAVLDSELVSYLRLVDICVELNPASNIMLGFVDSMKTHPGRQLIEEGVQVTISTDDPSLFQTTLTDEYKKAYQAWELTREEMIDIAQNGMLYALADEKLKIELLQRFEEEITLLREDDIGLAPDLSVKVQS
ncbi:MAG: adenosine deaminase [Candidatus Dojkabacteria bacterium]